jgi:glycosyltransferase involved in cell wall biosynthesis
VVYTRHSAFPVPSYLQKGLGHWMNGLVNSHYADRIIAVSPACQQNLLDSGVPAEKITVMMNGVDPVPRATAERCQALRQELQIPPKVFTAGILARLEPYKGHQTLLEAARLLKEEGRDFRILIGGSGPEEAHIRDSIRELDLTDRVLFLGFVNNVSEVLSLLDVQLNCSYGTEASSLALIEGMSLGLATVASDYGGNPWQVEDGETGLLFPARDSAALAQRLGRLMDDPDLLRRLQASARTSYETRYTGEIFAHNIESVYQQILEK